MKMVANINNRNSSIDMLRFIGLSLIILAHVYPPYIIFNLRCFDVPMMLFVSGLAYSNHKIDFSRSFFIKRLLRLVVPVYMFLSGYFLLAFALKYAVGIDFGIRWQHIIGSYLLLDGIGYVWIIRIFLLIALLTPLLKILEQSVRSNILLLLILAIVSALVTVAIRKQFGMDNFFVSNYLYYAVGYSVPFVAGLRVCRLNGKQLILFTGLLCACAAIFCGLYIMGGGNALDINALKYPPQAWFLFYGVVMSLICYIVCCRTRFSRHIPGLCRFVGMNTIWIYLYHIPLIQLTGMLSMSWWLRYIIVYFGAVSVYAVHNFIVKCVQSHWDSSIFKYLKG